MSHAQQLIVMLAGMVFGIVLFLLTADLIWLLWIAFEFGWMYACVRKLRRG